MSNSTGRSALPRPIRRYGPYAFLVLVAVWTLLPLFWMALSSLKIRRSMFEFPPTVFFDPTFRYYVDMFLGSNPVTPFLINSIIVALGTAVLSVGLGTIGGYGLSRLDLRGKKHLAFWIISTRMAPIVVVVIPLFYIYNFLNLLNTHIGLIIAHTTFNLPFAVWLMRSFFDEVPEALEEAARIDGATKWEAFRKVSLPLVLPGMGATAIIAIVFSWNDFIFALIFTSNATQTMPVAASQLITQTGTLWGRVMATGVVILLPMVTFGVIVKRYLVSGLTMGAVKE
jgi:multiple sugar transport system permease protein